MKLLVVLAVLVTLCAGSAIPLVPGDNSHYVEGESRYIWMPDGHGKPHLVDLHAQPDEAASSSRNGEDNEYWLYTRKNPTNPQVIDYGNAYTIWSSNYLASRPLIVIVHGWLSDGDSDLNPAITEAYLNRVDGNVIVVDWSRVANRFYTTASRNVPSIGQHLGKFLIWLINTTGGKWKNVHLVGFSLGAHVVGAAGRTANGLPARVTGLDPAGPLWGGNSDALNIKSGVYVETINTDGGFLGINDPIGTTNFYPNGGNNRQPGCLLSPCSHSRSHELFASTVLNDHLIGRECDDFRQATRNECTGATLKMGNANLSKRGRGLYALSTGRSYPY